MIEAVSPTGHIRRAYDLFSHIYLSIGAPLERKPRMIGLERARITDQDKVLDVAVGPGSNLVEILKKVNRNNMVTGIDLSPKMIAKARCVVSAMGYSNIDLRVADARQLPFADRTFDVLYNSYMLDLVELKDMSVVLQEFKRVLKPGGRLVLVNLSKENAVTRTWYEFFYDHTPKMFVPYIFGGCRPVLMENLAREAGFIQVERQFIKHIIPSEIVVGQVPGL